MQLEGIALRMTAFQQRKSASMATFERIMSQCERRVLRIAMRLLNDPGEAQDAAQEVFLRLYKNIDRLDPALGCEAWLFRVTINVCRDIARRRRVSVPLEQVDLPADAVDAFHKIAHAEQRDLLRIGLAHLGEKERAALVLRDVEGLSTRDVAAILGCSENTVRSHICTARLKLRELTSRMTRKRS